MFLTFIGLTDDGIVCTGNQNKGQKRQQKVHERAATLVVLKLLTGHLGVNSVAKKISFPSDTTVSDTGPM